MTVEAYKCRRCPNIVASGIKTIPGPQMGQTLIMEQVCPTCLDSMVEYLEENFWKTATERPAYQCMKCGVNLSEPGRGKRTVQYLPNDDGTWELANVCVGCFDLFVECCDKHRERE